MSRFAPLLGATMVAIVAGVLTATVSAWWLLLAIPFGLVTLVGVYDLLQRRHSVLRNYPMLGHLRFTMEALRPEVHQYFVESDTGGRPFARNARSLVYERAKEQNQDKSFGTELDVYGAGHEFLAHSMTPVTAPDESHRVSVGGPQCSAPYAMSLLNVSALSFGALSGNAISALNLGARLGGFAHDTGEGGISRYHLKHGGDLVWELGSGYFGCRSRDGGFDPHQFGDHAANPQVVAVSIKLSQGAKPGVGGIMPAAKVSPEIAQARGVPAYETCVSPPAHSEFSTPVGLLEFVARLRDLSGGKPTGFKLCVGRESDFLAICKAMLDTGIRPDFIIVDGSEGGTGAGPLEFQNHMGMPLTEGLSFVHNALTGVDVRRHIAVGASGKIASGWDVVSRLMQGADYTNSGRAMMMALGCIQAQRCHTNTCPVGVTTQDPKRVRALVVGDKAKRVQQFQHETVASAQSLIAAMGATSPRELRMRDMIRRAPDQSLARFDSLFARLGTGELLSQPPQGWEAIWNEARADRFI